MTVSVSDIRPEKFKSQPVAERPLARLGKWMAGHVPEVALMTAVAVDAGLAAIGVQSDISVHAQQEAFTTLSNIARDVGTFAPVVPAVVAAASGKPLAALAASAAMFGVALEAGSNDPVPASYLGLDPYAGAILTSAASGFLSPVLGIITKNNRDASTPEAPAAQPQGKATVRPAAPKLGKMS